ncbi:MAG: tetratricopeptide repeat protein, partial [Deltaproteobacteria bacterium]|nr:tetratricopeptide repeat protein [Deltaproteobacteria bacterium]
MRCTHCHFSSYPGAVACENCGDPLGLVTADLARMPSVAHAALAGRGAELAQLELLLEQVISNGSPLSVVVLGPTGIGKRRLVTELYRRVRAVARAQLYRGYLEDDEQRPYGLFRRLLRNRYRYREDEAAAPQVEAIRNEVSQTYGEEAPQILDLLAVLADLPALAGPRGAGAGNPPESQGFSFASLSYYLEQEARRRPMLLTLEGLHVAGEESIELFHYLVESLKDAPVLLLTTSLPSLLEQLESWKHAGSRLRVMQLAPLSEASSASLLQQLLEGVEEIPRDLAAQAYERTNGFPALILQFVRSLIASGAIRSDGESWRFDPQAFSPHALESSFALLEQARVEQLPAEDRMLVVRASVMGPIFWLEGLALLARAGKRREGSRYLWRRTPWLERIRVRMERLVEEGILIPAEDPRLPGEEAYSFMNPGEQQRLYRSLSLEEARHYHHLLAQWLEHTHTEQPPPARLVLQAKHLESAQLPEQAARCYAAAGRLAAIRLEAKEAEALLSRALKLRRPDDALFCMDVLHDLGDLAATAGDVSRAMGYFTAMLEWAWLLDHRRKGGAAYNRIGRLHRKRGNLDRSMDCIMTAWGLFESAGDLQGVASCMDDVGQIHALRGCLDEALDHYRQALALRRKLGEPRGIALSLHNIGAVLAQRGDHAAAMESLTEALGLRKSLHQLNDVIASLTTIGLLYRNMGQAEQAGEIWQEALTLVRETGDRQQQAQLLVHLGEMHLGRGNPQQAKVYLEQALALGRR